MAVQALTMHEKEGLVRVGPLIQAQNLLSSMDPWAQMT